MEELIGLRVQCIERGKTFYGHILGPTCGPLLYILPEDSEPKFPRMVDRMNIVLLEDENTRR